jgi:hypothetical protein
MPVWVDEGNLLEASTQRRETGQSHVEGVYEASG